MILFDEYLFVPSMFEEMGFYFDKISGNLDFW